MTPDFLKLDRLGDKFYKLASLGDRRLADQSLSAISVVRITDGVKMHIAAEVPARKIYVTSDALAAKSVYRRLRGYLGDKVVYLPHRDDVLLHRKGFSAKVTHERMTALSKLALGEADTVVVSADALLQRLPCEANVLRYTAVFKKDGEIAPLEAARRLALAGYVRTEMIAEEGDFALRGDILDIFVCDGRAVRINFFDELIEDIKLIDPVDMLAKGELEEIIVPPASDILLDPDTLEKARTRMKARRDSQIALDIMSGLREGACSPAAVWATPFIDEATESIFDYFDKKAVALSHNTERTNGFIDVSGKRDAPSVMIIDEPKVVRDKLAILIKEFLGRLAPLTDAGEILDVHKGVLFDLNEIDRRLLTMRKVSMTSLNLSNPMFEPKLVIEPKCRVVTKYYLDRSSIHTDLNNFIINGFKVMLCCGNSERARGVRDSLYEEGIYAEYSEDGNGAASVLVTPLGIEDGFVYPALKVAVIGVAECVGKNKGQSISLPKTQFSVPKAGDYVVHKTHGIGFCEGTAILKNGEFEREYIVLRYKGGDVLYVATDQMDNLQKFIGEEDPPLNKMGGKEFEREKQKVRSSIRKLAVNLLQLYAKREKQKGFVYSSDTVWQKEFEDEFEYQETPDQLKAIAEIKADMESGRIMDRVLVGDVGFGKTEVAFRAMFKTVLDSKQAVLLAPTTILARQHYENLSKRLQPFGIRCELLNRLQVNKKNEDTVKALADGTVHMVVATHKVLGKNIAFHDLGLLVVDEEQRFGVEHKEILKEKFPFVNVLTLSATPIPRTLNMALSGVRDISLLETAPEGRLPIQTYVSEYSDTLAADAIVRECARGGQTLILLNDIAALDLFSARLRAILPTGVRLLTAHGQMAGGELDRRMGAFYDKQYDVLIATTIIENGIDLPDANTLIVVDSENFGLSQLYQLRGRVGRRGVLAHAYFTVPPSGVLTEKAEKRLNVLLENTEIGSGFKVALSDLSIRGAGNLLGAEQHGHIERVGYEMYIELLNEAIEEVRTGREHRDAKEIEMKVDAAAFIRDGFISGRDKMRIYKQISAVASFEARDALIGEISQVYGEVERPLKNLIDIALLKNMAKQFDASRIVINKTGAGVNFHDSEVFKNQGLLGAAAMHSNEVVLSPTIPPSLIFDVKGLSPEGKIDKLLRFFDDAAGFGA